MGSVLGFGSQKSPELPPIKPVTPMPDDDALRQAERLKRARTATTGRASTFLSSDQTSTGYGG